MAQPEDIQWDPQLEQTNASARMLFDRGDPPTNPAALCCFCGTEHHFESSTVINQMIICPCGQVWTINSSSSISALNANRGALLVSDGDQSAREINEADLPSDVSLANTLMVRAYHAIQRWSASKQPIDFDKDIGRIEAESLTAPLSVEQDGETFRAVARAIYEGKGGPFRNRQPLIEIIQRAGGPE